jgi:hypothetical protein
MASTKSIRVGPVVFQHTDAARQEASRMRAARIDALGVDRSHLLHYPLPIPSPEMVRGEQRVARWLERNEVTIADRLTAFRRFFAMMEKDQE